MRLIVDFIGNRHNDLFIKFDLFSNNQLIISDSYYWSDFLQIDEKEYENKSEVECMKMLSTQIVKYWLNIFDLLEKNETKYLPIDLSDEYISFLRVTKTKLGFKIQKIISKDLAGWNFNKELLERNLDISNNVIIENEEFLVSEEIIRKGLSWSLQQIDNFVD